MKDQPDNIAVLADDLTGALDCAAAFLSSGFHPFVSIGLEIPEGLTSDLLSLNMDTRRLSPQNAANVVKHAVERVQRADIRPVYVKIDSTLRGHPGLEIAQAVMSSAANLALVSPAFPSTGRTVLDGVLLVGGVPLAETEVGRDSLSPSKTSRVANLLQAHSDLPVAELPLSEVRGNGLSSSLSSNLRDENRLLSCDSESDDDLDRVVIAGVQSSNVIFAGSAGLAAALARAMEPTAGAESSVESNDGEEPILVVTASQRSLADQQIEHASSSSGLVSVPVRFNASLEGKINKIEFDRSKAAEALLSGANLALRALVVSDLGEASPSDVRMLADDVTIKLGEIVTELTTVKRPSAIVLVGGDTALAVLSALGSHGIFLRSQPLPGVPVGVLAGGPLNGVTVATKAGAFGDERTLTELFRFLLKDRTLS